MCSILDIEEAILCSSCSNTIFEFIKSKGYDICDICQNEDLFKKYTNDSLEDYIICNVCSSIIEEGEVYYNITIKKEILEEIADNLSENIEGCSYCEGNERAEFVHMFNNDPYDSSSRMDFEDVRGMSVSDYLYEQGVPEELHELFSKLIICRCGYGREDFHPKHNPIGGIFTLDDDIYTKRDIIDFWGFDDKEFSSFGERYGETFSVEDLYDFRDHLINYPMLALQHKTGQAIFNTLKKHFETGEYTVLIPGGISLFRGRTRKKDTEKPFSKEVMWSAPQGIPQHGRFNSIGVPVLYVCDNLCAIPYEIHPTNEDVIDIAEFELCKELKLFDIGKFDPGFQGFFTEKNQETKLLKRAYLLPNFIGMCCSFIGYDGVKYSGVYDSELTYSNYALFKCDNDDIMFIKCLKTYEPYFKIQLKMKTVISMDCGPMYHQKK